MKSAFTKIRLIVFVLALVCATTIAVWFSANMFQYEFVLSEPEMPVARISQVSFRDLDKDGRSERIEVYNNPRPEDTFYININAGSQHLINQWYVQDSILIHHLQYLDMTNDQIDELIVWTQGRDSLFLSIIDITHPEIREIYNTFVLRGPEQNTHKIWDIRRIHALHTPEKPQSLFFTIFSGHSLAPRGIFEFDLKKRTVVNEFPFNAALAHSKIFDLDADGRQEVLVSTSATSNFPDSAQYSDAFSWFFVFNLQLELLHAMKKEGTFGGIKFTPGDFPSNPSVFLIVTQADRNTEILKMDKHFHIVAEKKLRGYTTDVLKFGEDGRGQVYSKGWQQAKKLIIDTNLVVLDSILFEETKTLNETVDIDNNGKNNFYYHAGNRIYFIDENMKKIAFFEMEDGEKLNRISLKRTPGKPNEIAFNTTKNSYLTKLQASFVYTWFWPLFILQVIVYAFVLHALQLVFIRIRIYFAYFRFSLKESDNAILLINHKGRILSINHNVEDTLMLEKRSEKQQDVFSLLQQRNEICDAISLALKENRQISKAISFSSASSNFIGSITITPLRTYFHLVNAYLIEIRDNTKQIIVERQQNWQRNVRRMVHDIKNPLAGVQLKLQTIYLRLMEDSPEMADKLQDEIEIANSEIHRILSISKEFLKFSDLTELKLAPVNIEQLLAACIDHFKAFVTENMKMALVFKSEIKMAAWDKRQIELLMHVLIENAIDALQGKGNIAIEVTTAQNLSSVENQFIRISVTDDGHGIEPQQFDKIFEPNYSAKPEGSGMGLVFARQIVHQHHGRLHVDSEPGKKTVFIISLPIDAQNDQPVPDK
ncbi:MAG: sensor histidine kinase [Calditrichaeota bacterium]|nr:MAG: sensor histidine kinase [Calditrichota bacterium]